MDDGELGKKAKYIRFEILSGNLNKSGTAILWCSK